MDFDVLELMKVIKNWSESIPQTVKNVLITSKKLSMEIGQSSLNQLLDQLTIFHKQITKTQQSKELGKSEGWFKQVQQAKKHIKKLLQDKKKQQSLLKQPKLIKSNSQIKIPEEITNENQSENKFVKGIYKKFLLHLETSSQNKSKEIISFLKQVVKHAAQDVGFTLGNDRSDDKYKDMINRIQAITDQFSSLDSSYAKIEMLEGKKKAQDVGKMQNDAFIGEKLKTIRAEKLKAIAKQNQTGYYDQLKKNINKDAKEECRFCRKLAAYCEDMKQIRSADEPMTRFMYCNACSKRWRQQ